VDVAGGVLDVGDDGRQLRGGGVGIVAHAANTPWNSPCMRAPRSAIGDRAQQRRDLAEVQSVVCIRRLRPSTIARKSCSKRACRRAG
jgi:hypothetical protein